MHRLVLLDLDKTIIDVQYRLNADPNPVIRTCAEKGISIGLCSDSSLPTLQRWASRLGITGPIIAERGAVVWDPISGVETAVHPKETSFFPGLTREFVKRVVSLNEPPTIFFGDASELIRNGITALPGERSLLLVNKYRKHSFSFYTKRFDGEKAVFTNDEKSLRSFSGLAEELVAVHASDTKLDWDLNPEYGIVILHAACTQKRSAVEFLLASLNRSVLVAMVGDSIADVIGHPRVAQYAVANASKPYREQSTFVSERSFTGGVCDILSRIAQGELD
ncbi:MAG: HAD hydrolase family protein [Candidatus Brennerbacteria bacterium]